MAINFPNSPSVNDIHSEGGIRWKWNGSSWTRASGAAVTDTITTANDNSTTTLYPVMTSGTGGQTAKIATTATKNISFDASDGNLTVGGNISAGGTITYEDVRNVDSIGIVTARTGIHIDDSITHIGDTNTKIRFPAADIITAETGGSERFRINSDRVIIGQALSNNQPTYDASTTLVTSSTNNAAAWNAIAIISGHTTGASFLKFGDKNDEDASFIGHYNADNSLRVSTDGSERLRITSAGLVGIGTITPTSNLHVANYSGDATIEIESGSTASSILRFGDTDNNDVGQIKYDHSDNSLGLYTANTTERLRIASGGDVGIGTDNPQAPLHIFDTVDTTLRLESADNGAVYHSLYRDNAGTKTRIGYMGFGGTGATMNIANEVPNGNIFFQTTPSGSSAGAEETAFRIHPDKKAETYGDLQIPDKIVHTGDTNTAIRFPAADTITAETAGTERLRILSTGMMSIGKTSNAGKAIEIYQAANAALRIHNSSTGTGSSDGILIEASGSDALFWNYESANIRLGTNNNERLRITSDGNIGINATSPNVSGFNSDARVLTISGPKRGILELRGSTQAADIIGSIRFFSANNNEAEITSVTDGSYNGDLRFTTNGSERLRIDSSGRLLLGTTTEGHAEADNFTISGSGSVGMTIRSTDSNSSRIYFSDATSGNGEQSGALIYRHSTNALEIYTNEGEKVRIDSSGKVMIGTSTPSSNGAAYMLTVADPTNSSGNCGITIRAGNTGGTINQGSIFYSNATSGTGEYAGYLQYNHPNNWFRIGVGSAERLRIDSNGDVRIGNTTQSFLDAARNLVVGSGGGSEGITIYSSSSDAGIIAFADGTSDPAYRMGQIMYDHGGNQMIFRTNGNNTRLVITSAGLIGIGNNSPGELLSLRHASSNTVLDLECLAANDGSTGNIIKFRGKGANGVSYHAAQIKGITENGANNAGFLSFWTNSAGTVAEKLRITSGGQVQLPINGQELAIGASQQFRMFWENSESRGYIKTNGAYGLAFRINNGNRIEINGTSGDVTMQGASGRNFQWDNSDASLYLTDNNSGASARLKVGSGGDLQLYHDVAGTNHITCANNHHLKLSAQSVQFYDYTGVTQYLRVKTGDDRVRVYGEAAVDGTSSGADGLSIAYNGGTSCPLYFGTETNVAQKSMYLKGYWIYLRGHVNEGMKFIFSQGSAAPHGNVYEFKYNSAKRPGNNTTWDGFSDSRAKENVQSITNGIEKIKQLRPVTFDWTDDYADSTGMWAMDKSDPKEYNWVSKKENGYDTDAKNGQYGFLAQEYETVLPKDVKKEKFTLGDTEISDFRSLNHDSLIATLTAALKESIAKIETLETKVAALEGS